MNTMLNPSLLIEEMLVDWARDVGTMVNNAQRMSVASLDLLNKSFNPFANLLLAHPLAGLRLHKPKREVAAVIKPACTPRLALVTGGLGGIGTEICRKLASLGHQVITTHVAAEADYAAVWQQERECEGYDIQTLELDVTDFDACAKAATEIENTQGGVDILINCAGITRDNTLRKMDEDQWHAVLDTNLDGVFNVTKPFLDGMAERGYGRIINISSVNGQRGQFGQTNYSAAKAGMTGFTRALAREVAENGITVNCVSPGYVATKMTMAVPEDVRSEIIAKVPVGRLAEPAEIAHAVAFLAAEESGYITGADISVNGGLFMS